MTADVRPGRPEVGPAIHTRLPDDLLEQVDAIAHDHDETRAETIRRLLAEAAAADQPWTVTRIDLSTRVRETASRHASRAAAVKALRDLQRHDHDLTQVSGLPSILPRVEFDGEPVDVD